MDVKKYRYSHVGMPTTERFDDEIYIEDRDLYISDHSKNEFGIEWLCFGPNSDMPEILQKKPHVGFEVDDIDEAIKGHEVIIEPRRVSDDLIVAFIIAEDGTPVEFLQFLN